MTAGTFAAGQAFLRAVAIPAPGERAKEALTRAALALGISYRTAKVLFYGEAGGVSAATVSRILADEAAKLRAELAQSRARIRAEEAKTEQILRRLSALGERSCSGSGDARSAPDGAIISPLGRSVSPAASPASPASAAASAASPTASRPAWPTRETASRADHRTAAAGWW